MSDQPLGFEGVTKELNPDLVRRSELAHRPADLREWREAAARALIVLAMGINGAHVHRDETWEQAIVRVAADLLAEHGCGRPRGEIPVDWIRAVWAIAGVGSKASDRMVQAFAPRGHAGSLRVSPHSLPHSPRDVEAM
jgi:hypothetical protein